MKKLILPFKQKIPLNDIVYMQSDSNYTQIYIKGKPRIIAAKSLCHLLADIDQSDFIRINRSQAINSSYINGILSTDHYALVTLKNGLTLRTSRRRKENFLKQANG